MFIRPQQLARDLGVSRSTLDKWVRSGRLPPPRRLTQRCVGWPEREIRDWLNSRPVKQTIARHTEAAHGQMA